MWLNFSFLILQRELFTPLILLNHHFHVIISWLHFILHNHKPVRIYKSPTRDFVRKPDAICNKSVVVSTWKGKQVHTHTHIHIHACIQHAVVAATNICIDADSIPYFCTGRVFVTYVTLYARWGRSVIIWTDGEF